MVEKSPIGGDGLQPAAQVLDFRNRERGVLCIDAGSALPDVDQPALIAIDERPQQDATHDAEDGGVGADAERQRQNDRDRESLDAREGTQSDFEILKKRHHRSLLNRRRPVV